MYSGRVHAHKREKRGKLSGTQRLTSTPLAMAVAGQRQMFFCLWLQIGGSVCSSNATLQHSNGNIISCQLIVELLLSYSTVIGSTVSYATSGVIGSKCIYYSPSPCPFSQTPNQNSWWCTKKNTFVFLCCYDSWAKQTNLWVIDLLTSLWAFANYLNKICLCQLRKNTCCDWQWSG